MVLKMITNLKASTEKERKMWKQQRAVYDAVAGSIAGCISRFVVGPLDVIKIRFQVQIEPIQTGLAPNRAKYTGVWQALRTIVKEEGLTALWHGTVPGQLMTIPYTAIQFVTLQQARSVARLMKWSENNSTLESFVCGGIAGAAATLSSYPFDLLRTTLAAQGEPKVYKGMMDAAWQFYKAHGIPGLYSGVHVTMIEIIPYSAIQFAAYDYFHQSLDHLKKSLGMNTTQRSSIEHFFCGLGAGVVSKLATHPLDVIKKRYQIAGLQRSLRYGERVDIRNIQSMLICLRAVLHKEGIPGLWKGSIPNILKAGPAAAVTLVCYELLIAWMTKTID